MRTKKLDRSFKLRSFCVFILFTIFLKIQKNVIKSHILRKFVLGKEIYIVDIELFINLQLLSNVTNNICQIIKSANTTGVIYKKDID